MPKRCLNAWRISEETSSDPFETVNWVTSRTAIAAVSATVQGAGMIPTAAYSAGSASGLRLTSRMRPLMPST